MTTPTKSCQLSDKKCLPCEGGIAPLSPDAVSSLLSKVVGWKLSGKRIVQDFSFTNFVEAMAFVNSLAEIAEKEGHHPDFTVHYNQVRVEIWTHAIGGLSENDFILAAQITKASNTSKDLNGPRTSKT